MSYKKADKVLPKDLLDEIQKYVQGEYLYIPSPSDKKKGWGVKSGAREELVQRNNEIREKFLEGLTIEELSDLYYLSMNTIKKIVYSKR